MKQKRLGRIKSELSRFDLEGILFFDMANIRYMTGFTGSEGALFVGESSTVLLVDGRYVTQAKGETEECEIFQFTDREEGITQVINLFGARKIGFESLVLSYDSYERLRNLAPDIELKPLSDKIGSVRARKDNEEIACLRRAAAIAAEALTETLEMINPGVTEDTVAFAIESKMREKGSEKPSFETIVASGDNSAMPHAKPRSYGIKKGDFAVIDYGAVYKGYHSDETCTFAVGTVSEEKKKVYGIVRDAHDRAIDAVRAGVSCKKIDGIARKYIEDKGFGTCFSHGTGHGVGLEVHEAPMISQRGKGYLEEGMVITVEPGIYMPGKWGVRIEDTILVKKDGGEILTKMPKDLRIL
jgi:Xaa-Pro aminopeptidase